MPITQAHVRGSLVGLAVGDALGGPVEFMSRFEIAQSHGGSLRKMVGGGWLKLKPGETTDDTAMARALAESIVACGELNVDDVAARYVAWLKTNPKDVGTITRSALNAWTKGNLLPAAALGAHRQMGGKSAGNGTIMRCAPIALRYVYDQRRMMDASRDEALITHFDPQAATGSMAINLLIHHLLHDLSIAEAVSSVAQRIRREPRAASEIADVLESVRANVRSDSLPTTGYVVDTLRIAVWALLAHNSFEEAVMAAVNLGGDADTQGAVAGALAGARWGYDSIPEHWLAPLQARDELIKIADRLLELAEHKRVVV
ncbi:MAG: ADP-ribosylglycohydrolase family protein [Chloroflexi bacterium]|nr:ADP-ribosylglycohydrolase family protein [Chloroflexota bacterium]